MTNWDVNPGELRRANQLDLTRLHLHSYLAQLRSLRSLLASLAALCDNFDLGDGTVTDIVNGLRHETAIDTL